MNTKITTTTAAVLFGISTLASAGTPPSAPPIYEGGPASPIVNQTDMSGAELQTYALYEAAMQAAEGRIHARGCQALTGTVEVFSDGVVEGGQSYIEVKSVASTLNLYAKLLPELPGFGQSVEVKGGGTLNGTAISDLEGTYTYNNVKNMMVNEKTLAKVRGNNGRADQYSFSIIKDFFHGETYNKLNSVQWIIYDYGLQSVSKLGYPVNKWWQRSKTIRDNGQQGCTVFVKDRLVGSTACRITLETIGYNNADYYWQEGTFTVEPGVKPHDPSNTLDSCVLL